MNMEQNKGYQESFGVTKNKSVLSFSLQAPEYAVCNLLLYPQDGGQVQKIPMTASIDCNTIYRADVCGLDWKKYEYNFEIDGVETCDMYARWISGREFWAEERRRPLERTREEFIPEKVRKKMQEANKSKKNIIKSKFYFSGFNWKDDQSPRISKEDMVIYKLHVRGFSMGMPGTNKRKGTFEAVGQRLDYFQKLGITTLMLLPVYEFEEFLILDPSKQEEHPRNMINYWGYTDGNYFAPKSAYLGEGNSPDAFKQLIRKMHEKSLECILEFYFDTKINPHLILDILHYWKREYHVDGFRLNCRAEIAELVACDGRLSGCKLFYDGFAEAFAADPGRLGPQLYAYNDAFLYEVRRMLNHHGGSIYEFACQMRRQQEHQGFVNYVAENNGFTLADLFAYAEKHNEENQEENRDGNDWNYSDNCGAEGETKKKAILQIRRRQMKNALAITFLSQGVPLLWMGDESANSQSGNNNAYCQDNAVGWKDWKNLSLNRQMLDYVAALAQLRRDCPLLHQPRPFCMTDYENRGCPDLSYHSDGGWQMDFGMNRGFVGIYYSGVYGDDRSFYAIYNFQNMPQKFALPKGMKWKLRLNTALETSIPQQPEPLGNIHEFLAEERCVCLLEGVPATVRRKGGFAGAETSV